MKSLRLKLTNTRTAILGLLGIGLLPCPGCGAPLAAHTWPIALLIWTYQRIRKRQNKYLDMLIAESHKESQSNNTKLHKEAK